MSKVRKMLVATRERQGLRRNDFTFVPDGEMVYLGSQCTRATPDDGCGCARSFDGSVTDKATTTAVVVEDADPRLLEVRVRESMARGGWGDPKTCDVTAAGYAYLRGGNLDKFAREFPTLTALSGEIVRVIETQIADFPIGTIVEYRGDGKILSRSGV